jgi:hypothetical protein
MNKLIPSRTPCSRPGASHKGLGIVRRALSLLLRLSFFIAVLGAVAAARQNPGPLPETCPPGQCSIVVTVVASPAPGGAPGLVWKIDRIPGPDQIKVCPRLQKLILKALEDTSPGTGNFQITGGDSGGGFFDTYIARVAGVELTPSFDTSTPPSQAQAGQRVDVVLSMELLHPNACGEPAAATAEIQIATDNIDRLKPEPEVRTFDAKVSNVPVKLFYTDDDLTAARKDPAVTDAETRVREELLGVARTVFDEAVKAGGLNPDGTPASDRQKVEGSSGAFETAIKDNYLLVSDIYEVRWTAGVKPNLKGFGMEQGQPGPPHWIWSVDGLHLADAVSIEVVEEEWESAEEAGESAAAKLRSKRQKVQEELSQKVQKEKETSGQPSFEPGHIPRRDIIGSLTQGKTKGTGDLLLIEPLVEAVDKVKSGPAPGSLDGRNVIIAVRRKKKPEMALGLKVGGAFSEEEGGTGHVGVEETNLLRFKETLSLDAEAGNEVQKYRFSFTRPFENSGEAGFRAKDLSVGAKVYKDKDKRLGNLTMEEIEAREVGSSATFSFGYESASDEERANENCTTFNGRERTRLSVNADVGLKYRDVNIRDDDKLLTITGVSRDLLPRERTQATTLSLGVSTLLRHDFRKKESRGPGVLLLRLGEDVSKGFHLFGADYEFWKSRTVAGADLTFGFSSNRDMFVSYNHGHERSSEGTPVFELPTLGGAASVRGVEEGEFIGRRVSFDQLDFGLNVNSLYNLFARKGRLGDSPFCPFEDNPEPPKMFDFKNLYVKGFFDHGRISDSPVAAASGGALRRADGYGFALELRDLMADASGRRVNLSIGYARSPHSRLHRSGMMYTGVTLDF